MTVEFSGAVTECVRQMLSDQKYNIILEGTFRTLETPWRITEELKFKGYTAELHAIAVPKDISYVGTLDRYFVGRTKGTGRAVDKQHHDLVAEKLPVHLKALAKSGMFRSMHLHTREREIFSTEHDVEAFMEQFQREVGRRLDFAQGNRLAKRKVIAAQDVLSESTPIRPANDITLETLRWYLHTIPPSVLFGLLSTSSVDDTITTSPMSTITLTPIPSLIDFYH